MAGPACPEGRRGIVDGYPPRRTAAPLGDPHPDDGAVVTGAVAWLAAHRAWLDPGTWDRVLPSRPFPGSQALEVLLLLRALADRGMPAPEADGLLEAARGVALRPGFRAGLRSGAPVAVHHLWLLALLERLGRPVPGWRDIAGRLAAADLLGVRNAGASALATLEQRHVLDLADLPGGPEEDVDELFRRWWSGHRRCPLGLSDTEVYALTHAILYVLDFGRRRSPAADDAGLRNLVGDLLGAAVARCDADLTAELLLCRRLLGGGDEPAARALLGRRVRPDGAVAGPLNDLATAGRLAGDRAAGYAFGTCYHPTVVTALALVEGPRGDGAAGSPIDPDPARGRRVTAINAVRDGDLQDVAVVLAAAAGTSDADDPLIGRTARWLAAQADDDGGFGRPLRVEDPAVDVREPLTRACTQALAAHHAALT